MSDVSAVVTEGTALPGAVGIVLLVVLSTAALAVLIVRARNRR